MNVTDEITWSGSSTAVVVIRTLFGTVNALAVVLANVLNLVILRRAQVGSEPARIFISSLALADILVGAVALASTVPSGRDIWQSGVPREPCPVAGSMFCIGYILSKFSLVLISVDRYIAVTMALRYVSLFTPKRAIITVALVWICISVFVVLNIILKPDIMVLNYNTFVCEPNVADPNFPVHAFIFIVVWIVACILIMMVTYGRLFLVAHRHSRRIAAQELAATAHLGSANRPRRKELKAVWMCLAITLAFNVAWVPTLCLNIYKFITKSNAAPALEFATTWLSLSNSWWNFLIYSGMNKQFRDATKQLAKQVCGKCRNRSSAETLSRESNLHVLGRRQDGQIGQRA